MNMSQEIIQENLDQLAAVMSEKGLTVQTANVTFNADASPYIYVAYGTSITDKVSELFRAYDGNLEAVFEEAHKFFEAMPCAEEYAKNEALKAVAKALELVRAAGFSNEAYEAELRSTMEAMSKNILTDQRRKGGAA